VPLRSLSHSMPHSTAQRSEQAQVLRVLRLTHDSRTNLGGWASLCRASAERLRCWVSEWQRKPGSRPDFRRLSQVERENVVISFSFLSRSLV
jgi:hypothetical protein